MSKREVAEMAAAARAAIKAHDEAVWGCHTGRAWMDAQDRWQEAERKLDALCIAVLESKP